MPRYMLILIYIEILQLLVFVAAIQQSRQSEI